MTARFLLAALGTTALAATAPAAADDPVRNTFKVDQARSGHLPEGPRPPLKLRWKFQSRETRAQIEAFYTTDDGFSPASVHDGVVYAGGHDGWVYALDAKTGRKIWEHRTDGHVMTTPQYRNGRVIAGSMDGYLRSLDARDGTIVWQVQFGARTWNGLRYSGMRATPLFYRGTIFMGG
jgi:outer membrane protein assembly factor BamB